MSDDEKKDSAILYTVEIEPCLRCTCYHGLEFVIERGYADLVMTVQPCPYCTKKLKNDILKSIPRRHLPDERHSITEKFTIGEDVRSVEGYFSISFFEDGTPGELFLVIAKSSGGMLHGFANAWSLAVSLALQYGMPVEKFVEKHRHVSFEPSGNTTLVDVPTASSIVDMIAQFFEARFVHKEVKQ